MWYSNAPTPGRKQVGHSLKLQEARLRKKRDLGRSIYDRAELGARQSRSVPTAYLQDVTRSSRLN